MSSPRGERVQCPVCSCNVSSSNINAHLDQCLPKRGDASKPTSSADHDVEDKPRKDITTHTVVLGKRKRSSGGLSINGEDPKAKRNILSPIVLSCPAGVPKSSTPLQCSEPSPDKITGIRGTQSPPFFGPTPDSSSVGSVKLCPLSSKVPFAEQMRPECLEDFVGQNAASGTNSILVRLIKKGEIPSLILWGPPGCGKTTLAYIIGNHGKKSGNIRFVKLSATTGSVSQAKEVITAAKNEKKSFGRNTILFIDEIHRFNKLQQDTFLPHVENGNLVLIGATTENPSFHINNALLSRCKVITLEKLGAEDVRFILYRAVRKLGGIVIDSHGVSLFGELEKSASQTLLKVELSAVNYYAAMCDGDARIALNGLEMALRSNLERSTGTDQEDHKEDSQLVTLGDAKESMQRSHVMYDRQGDEHYNMASALQKSIRGGDENAAVYWLARMLEGGENPMFVARRLVRIASEDVGLADVKALQVAVAAYQASHLIGMPECDAALAEAAIYLARAPKSFEACTAYARAKAAIKSAEGPLPAVPLHLRNAPTKLMKDLGFGSGYQHDPTSTQKYLPDELLGVNFFDD